MVFLVQLGYFSGQSVLHRLLELEIHCQLHGIAGAGLYTIIFTGDLAVAVDGDHPLAVRTPEVVLKGGFYTGEADGVIHPVATLLQIIGIVGDAAHGA